MCLLKANNIFVQYLQDKMKNTCICTSCVLNADKGQESRGPFSEI